MSPNYDWITTCRKYSLQVTASSWQQIDHESFRSGAIETGGILVGHYTNDKSTAVVTEALPPPKDSMSGRSWFHRGISGLRGLLVKRWKQQVRTYYIGEWHYHPVSILEPSGDDLAQMYGISADSRYQCRQPVMIIVGQARRVDKRPIRAFVFPQGEQYIEFKECKIDI
jgi:hypothetical protein